MEGNSICVYLVDGSQKIYEKKSYNKLEMETGNGFIVIKMGMSDNKISKEYTDILPLTSVLFVHASKEQKIDS